MASIQIPSANALLAANGAANGVLTVADNKVFYIGAYCYLSSDVEGSIPVIVVGKNGGTEVVVSYAAAIGDRGTNYSLVDASVFLTADNAALDQVEQLVSAASAVGIATQITTNIPAEDLVVSDGQLGLKGLAPDTAGDVVTAALVSGELVWTSAAGGGGGGTVLGVTGTAPIGVDNTDPTNPVVEFTGTLDLLHGGTNTDLSTAADGFLKKSSTGVVTAGTIEFADLDSNAKLNTKYVVAPTGWPYASIQTAIAAAELDTLPQAIYILPGTYTENVTISKAGIQLFGVQGGTEAQGVIVNGNITVQLTNTGTVGASNLAANRVIFSGAVYQRLSLNNCRIDSASGVALTLSNTAVSGAGTNASAVLADSCFFGSVGSDAAADVQAGYLEATSCNFRGASTGYSVKVSAVKSGSESIVGANIKLGELVGQVNVANAAPTAYATCYLSPVTVTTSGAGYYPVSVTNGYIQLAEVGLIGAAGTAGAFGSGGSVLVHTLVSAPFYGSTPFYTGTWASVVALPFSDAAGDLTGTYPAPTIATGAVTNTKLGAGAVTDAKVAVGAAISRTKLANGTPRGVVLNDASGVMTDLVGTATNHVLTWDGTQWISQAASGGTIASVQAASPLTVDVTNPANPIVKISNQTAAEDGKIIKWDNGTSAWVVSNLARANVATGSANHVIINDGSGVLSSEAILSASRGGTGVSTLTEGRVLLGGSGGTSVNAYSGSTNGHVLTWNGSLSKWEGQAPTGGVTDVTASSPLSASGTGTKNISLTGTVGVTNGGTGLSTIANNTEILISNGSVYSGHPISGDATMTNTGAVTVTKIQGNAVSATTPATGQALVYSGSDWAPATIGTGGSGAGGGGMPYYLQYDVAGASPLPPTVDGISAKKMAPLYVGAAEQNTGPIIVPDNSTGVVLAQFVTETNLPNTTTIPAGDWDLLVYAQSTASTGSQASIWFEILKWDGTTATLLATSPNLFLYDPTEKIPYTVSVYVPLTTIATTDRIIIRIRGRRQTSSSHTITLYFLGNSVSHLHTSFNAVGGTGLVKVVDGIYQNPASQLVDTDVSASAAIARSKLASGTADHVVINSGAGAFSSEAQLAPSRGGTGVSSPTAGRLYLGAGSSAMTALAGTTANDVVLWSASGGGTWTAAQISAATVSAWGLAGNSLAAQGYIGSTNSYDVSLIANNNTLVHLVASTGRVGIGTTSPAVALEVQKVTYINKNGTAATDIGNTTGPTTLYGTVKLNGKTDGVAIFTSSDGTVSSTTSLDRTYLATGTAGYVVINDDSTGELSSEQYLLLKRGGTAADLSAATNGPVYKSGTSMTTEQYLDVTRGGTGIGSVTAGYLLRGNGTSALSAFQGTSLNNVVTWDGSQWTAGPSASGSEYLIDVTDSTGWVVGDIVASTSSGVALADADALDTARAFGVITSVVSSTQIKVAFTGQFTVNTNLTAVAVGSPVYVDVTSGKVTAGALASGKYLTLVGYVLKNGAVNTNRIALQIRTIGQQP